MQVDFSSDSDATIIVAQHGGSEMTISCLQSIRQHERTNWPTIVIDDGSPLDHRRALMEVEIENATLIFQEHRYLTAIWNNAAKLCETPYLVFLNNDVTVRGEFIMQLIEPLRTSNAAMTGVRFREEKALPRNLLDALSTQRFLEGWCFALKKETYDTLGGFDPKMRLYFSDTDLQLRIVQATCGSNSLVEVPDLPLKHHGHRTAHRLWNRNEIWQQDRRAFIEKWSHLETATGL